MIEGKLAIDGIRPPGQSITIQNANITVPNNQMGSSNVVYSQRLVQLANKSIATPSVQVTPQTSNPQVTGQIASSVPQPTTTGEPEEVHQIMKWLFQPVNVPQPRANTRASPITSTGVTVPATASATQSIPEGLASKPLDQSPSQEALAPKQLMNMPLLQESNLSSHSLAISSPVASQPPPVSSSAGFCHPTQRSDVSSLAPPNLTRTPGLQELLFKDTRPVVPSTSASSSSNSTQHSQDQPIVSNVAPPKPSRGLRELIFHDYRPPSTTASSSCNSTKNSQVQPVVSVVTPPNPAVTENQQPTSASPVVTQVNEKQPLLDKMNPAPGTSATVEKPMTVVYRWSWESMELSLDKDVSSPISTDSNSNHSVQPEQVEIPQLHIVEDPSETNQSVPAESGEVEILVVASTSKEGESAKEPEQTVATADAAESSKQTERTISPTESTTMSVTIEETNENYVKQVRFFYFT